MAVVSSFECEVKNHAKGSWGRRISALRWERVEGDLICKV